MAENELPTMDTATEPKTTEELGFVVGRQVKVMNTYTIYGNPPPVSTGLVEGDVFQGELTSPIKKGLRLCISSEKKRFRVPIKRLYKTSDNRLIIHTSYDDGPITNAFIMLLELA